MTNVNEINFKSIIKKMRKENKGKQLNEGVTMTIENDKFKVETNGDHFTKFIKSRKIWSSGIGIDAEFINGHFSEDAKIKMVKNGKEIDINKF